MELTVMILLFMICTIIPEIEMDVLKPLVQPKKISSDQIPLNDMTFYLYTSRRPNIPKTIVLKDKETLVAGLFNPKFPLKVVIHGWKNHHGSPINLLIRQALLNNGDFNMLVVDWHLIAFKNYIHAANRVRAIGAHVGAMVDFFVEMGSDPTTISVIGHSLGAHIAALTAVQASTKIKHVVGLDPAFPGFDGRGSNSSISKKCAEYVEIVHSNAGKFGLKRPVGHADFYVNGGGPIQPGCDKNEADSCAHGRAYEYYAESLSKPQDWQAIKCDSVDSFNKGKCNNNPVVRFPFWAADFKKPHGTYYLRTSSVKPYGLGIQGTKPTGKT